MIERDKNTDGALGSGDPFSVLYVACLQAQLNGELVIWDDDAGCEGRIAFRDGHPFHVGGEAFAEHPIGRVLLELGSVDTGDIEVAVETQKSVPPGEAPLLGEILGQALVLDDGAIESALEIQTKRRLIGAFSIANGMWRCQWAKREDFTRGGAAIDGWTVLIPGVRESTDDKALRRLNDDLLGHSVMLTCTVEEAHAFGHDAADEPILISLEKPRKPDQLEREIGNRRHVRAVLLALSLAGKLERLPAHKGVPFAKTPRRSKTEGAAPAPRIERASTSAQPKPTEPKPRPAKASADTKKLADDIKAAAKGIDDRSCFDLLGATESTPKDDLRVAYTDLVRKYHPDALSQQGLPQDVLDLAAELSGKLNEAYDTLTDDRKRAEYLRLYHDDRIKGSSRKKALLDDAQTKFKMALVLLKKRNYTQARELLKYATESDGKNGTYKAYFAWSLWTDPSLLIDVVGPKVMDLLAAAVKLAPDDAQAHYFYGAVLKVRGDLAKAQKFFRKTLEIDPRHVEATRELRLMRMRQKK